MHGMQTGTFILRPCSNSVGSGCPWCFGPLAVTAVTIVTTHLFQQFSCYVPLRCLLPCLLLVPLPSVEHPTGKE
jgi:hypothetical protein